VSSPKSLHILSFRHLITHNVTDSSQPNLTYYQRVPRKADSDKVFQVINGWIKNCSECHYDCRDIPPGKLPTRLVDVGPADGSQEPYLFITSEGPQLSSPEDTRYTALSYCWGTYSETNPPFTTTLSTLQERKTGMSMKEIPRTIRDAITITRRLGIQYLWVDSLCILQGPDPESRADWYKEAPRMSDVHGGAFLTIAAAWGQGVHDGIFFAREDPDLNVTEFALASETSASRLKIFLGLSPPASVTKDNQAT